MDLKILINQLGLSYSPVCNYDFTLLKKDPEVKDIFENSNLYVVAQRPQIRFDNIVNNTESNSLEFEIRQTNNPHFLKCSLPIFQKNIATRKDYPVFLYLGSNDENNILKEGLPINNVHGIKIYEDEEMNKFLIWLTPEKFLQNHWEKAIEATIEGDVRNFTKYQVHYVGQSTKQDIWKRLTGHEKLQDILSLEYPFAFGSLPTHEIAILLFEFRGNMQMNTIGDDISDEDMLDFVTGKLPDTRTMYLDAEKALINSMQPKYNDELFNKYPKSKDGLSSHNFTSISYTLTDPITLVYKAGEIEGGLNHLGGDTILIKNNKTVELVKAARK
ncbi:MAG: hypothetical protein ACJ77K_17710 [Bacteroidia bacterium]